MCTVATTVRPEAAVACTARITSAAPRPSKPVVGSLEGRIRQRGWMRHRLYAALHAQAAASSMRAWRRLPASGLLLGGAQRAMLPQGAPTHSNYSLALSQTTHSKKSREGLPTSSTAMVSRLRCSWLRPHWPGTPTGAPRRPPSSTSSRTCLKGLRGAGVPSTQACVWGCGGGSGQRRRGGASQAPWRSARGKREQGCAQHKGARREPCVPPCTHPSPCCLPVPLMQPAAPCPGRPAAPAAPQPPHLLDSLGHLLSRRARGQPECRIEMHGLPNRRLGQVHINLLHIPAGKQQQGWEGGAGQGPHPHLCRAPTGSASAPVRGIQPCLQRPRAVCRLWPVPHARTR